MQLKWPMLWDLFSLFPAYAGVILFRVLEYQTGEAFPRIRGGDPFTHDFPCFNYHFSPHTRG